MIELNKTNGGITENQPKPVVKLYIAVSFVKSQN